MKTLNLTLALLACASACTPKVAEGTFKLCGTVEKGDCTNLYLVSTDRTAELEVDTLSVENGKFTFTDSLTADVEERLLVAEYPIGRGNRNMRSLFLEEGNLEIVIPDADSLSSAVLTGSATQAEMDEVNALLKPYVEPLQKLNTEFYKVRSEGDTVRLAQVQKEIDEVAEKYHEVENGWISNHPMSYYAFTIKSHGISNLSLQEADSLLNSFPDKFVGTNPYNVVKKELDGLRKSAPGAPASDFTDTDINGNEFTLSTLKGHYIILDFWASWCVPCRKSMPHLLKLYEKYKEKGLEVVCISDNDSRPDDWREAVEKDGLQPFHHVLRGLKRSTDGSYDFSKDKSSDYAVHYLPTKVLIDPDFKIVGKMDEDELDAKLQEVFGF